MIFCTYCGKSFTRKEHLERHIPSHTNVKPHRCTLCQLSFPRRDLLQRHHFTYHEAQDPMQPVSGAVPTIAGRTPIACINCANAKTGCDKAVPCSRCSEKNLPCEARFARRSGKSSMRSQSLSNASTAQRANSSPRAVNRLAPKEPKLDSPPALAVSPMTSRVQSPPKTTPAYANSMPMFNFGTTPLNMSPSESVRGGIDTFMCMDEDMLGVDPSYQDFMMWNQYPAELEMFPNPTNGKQFMEMAESYSSSDALVSHSMHTSVSAPQTGSTSISSQADFERQFRIFDHGGVSAGDGMIPEFEVVIAAESAWPLARCNRPTFSGACPRTAILHLENLEQHSRYESTWSMLDTIIDSSDVNYKNQISVVPFSSSTRDRILAITQSFLHTALETHRGGMKAWDKGSPHANFNFLVLPPSKVLEYFLRSYVRSLAPYYTLINGGALDPNELMLNNQASTLLLLLMIASGATAVETSEARCLTAGLTETCRISLFNIIEKDVELSADPIVLRCALLFTILGAWSGDAWHMKMAMGQRGMYLSMLKHAGMLEPLVSGTISSADASNLELQWRAWQQQESKNRLVYNWVMVDQELSLFHDTAPVLSISELQTPMPGMEGLWLARDGTEWLAAIQQSKGPGQEIGPPTPSLCDLFQDFLHDNLSRRYDQLSPLQLKLLLHPLQALLCHLRQVLSCFSASASDFFGARRGSRTRTVTRASTMLRMEEVQSLLHQWYELCAVHAKADPACPVTRANLVLYHLVSLNAVTCFPEIERLARRERFDGSRQELAARYQKCIHQPEEALIHCGQVLRLVSAMPREGRPYWWSAAIYRAALILWLEGLSRPDLGTSSSSSPIQPSLAEKGPLLAIDAVMPDDRAVVSYLWNGEGVPVLTSTRSEGNLEIRPEQVLGHCVALLEQGVASRVSDGIKRKLLELSRTWVTASAQEMRV